MSKEKIQPMEPDEGVDSIRRQQLQIGWWALLLFVLLGLILEALHGFKSALYLDVQNETRRLMWTLAHAHGTLIALINIVFGLALPFMPGLMGGARQWASRCLIAALLAMPAGFFLGGVFLHGGDPGLGVVLVPIGGVSLVFGLFLIARGSRG